MLPPMDDLSSLPLRWDAAERPSGLPVRIPPKRLAPLRRGRPLKRWRYVAAFSDELMLCAGRAAVGPARSSWWAVWDRERRELLEHTRLVGPSCVRFADGGRVLIGSRRVAVDVTVREGRAIDSLNAHGGGYVWTRKQAGRPVRGRVTIDGRERAFEGLAVVDETAGYHARETEWWWSAGVGREPGGQPVGWNLVAGVNDGPTASERSIWSAGGVREAGPVAFAADLSAVAFTEGGKLQFQAEAVRERHDGVLVVKSDYRQPFGTFDGTLPGVGRVLGGLGVMEHHVARW